MTNFKSIFVLLIFILLTSFNVSSQVTISGKVYGALSNLPLSGVEINEIGGKIKTYTDKNGYFTFIVEEKKIVNLSFTSDEYESYFASANGKVSDQVDMGIIKLYPLSKIDEEDVSLLNEAELSEDNESQRVSSLLTSSWDIFSRTAAYNFGVARFRVRGLGNEYGNMYLNGMPMNNLDDGYIAWSIWGGLNDVMRRKNSSSSLEPAFFDFGALAGATNVSLLASDQWKQTRVSYAVSNRSYRNRLMATYSTGMMENGWAFSFSGSRRWAQEGFKPGTF
ncbi:MAG TPA: TonB-dependent receptor, partial [Bacteroidetes bacterium]|nr:TonB-dependent receptor [Bacteroidota bacterium]